ncbi:hypothetical protein HZH66_004263 [Vespula vulgaris]|uniref:Uncharacterized protein n=1 Tax=Vespula vulgaris TaxID=7454 RepID=A0A834KG72_VESVU|nr:hypothetical protein HZH66_004263 [Vespula vulgaris]
MALRARSVSEIPNIKREERIKVEEKKKEKKKKKDEEKHEQEEEEEEEEEETTADKKKANEKEKERFLRRVQKKMDPGGHDLVKIVYDYQDLYLTVPSFSRVRKQEPDK